MNSNLTSTVPPPSFILSCERAGSTLLRYIVDTHPDMCSPPELHTGRLCESLVHMFSLLGLGQVSNAVDRSDRYRLAYSEARRVVSEWMSAYADSKGRRMWCEKSPRNLKYLDVLKEVFPDAKYICLHRHCMDVVHSCLEGAGNGFFVDISYYARNISDSYARTNGNHISTFIDSWMDKTDRLLRFERENPSNCYRIKYESIVEDPGAALKPMFEFLGVEWDEKVLDQVFAMQHDQGPGDRKVAFTRKIHRDSIGQGMKVSTSLIPADILEKMNATLTRLDYPEVGPGWEIGYSNPRPPNGHQQSAPVSDQNGQSADSAIRNIFGTHFPRLLKKNVDRLSYIRGRYKFVVTGDGGGTWTIDLKSDEVRIGQESGESDCTIMVSSDDLIRMVNGQLNAANASMQGRLRVAGDSRLALMIGPILLGA